MEYWEFLIQREGDRGWRTIKTGNLQLMEGRYRIVANSHLVDTQIQTHVTHQTTGSTKPQRRSQSRTQITNSSGVLIIVPFTQIQSGIWQFVCRGTTAGVLWQRKLKLRVLQRTPAPSPVNSTQPLSVEILDLSSDSAQIKIDHSNFDRDSCSKPLQQRSKIEQNEDIPTPTEPMVPISMVGEPENWADGLERLLEQLERDSLRAAPQTAAAPKILAGTIQLNQIVDSPSHLISLDRSTFSGIVPGHQLTISGTCNLHRLKPNSIQSVKVARLSICLRHPQTAEIIVAIEQSLPTDLNTFAFRGQLELPTASKITLLLGEVNLYDKHHIQLGSGGFTVTLNLNPLQESELSLLELFDGVSVSEALVTAKASSLKNRPPADPATTLDLLNQELQPASVTVGSRSSSIPRGAPSTIRSLQSPQTPTAEHTYQQESLFTYPDIVPVNSAPMSPHHTPLNNDITDDLELDFAISSFVPPHDAHKYENLEVVVED
jgi:hypothetical protein